MLRRGEISYDDVCERLRILLRSCDHTTPLGWNGKWDVPSVKKKEPKCETQLNYGRCFRKREPAIERVDDAQRIGIDPDRRVSGR